MGVPAQEVFWSMYQSVDAKSAKERPEPLAFRATLPFTNIAPIVNHYLTLPCPYLAYLVAKDAIKIPAPSGARFVEKWMYEWGALLQFAKASYLMGYLQEMKKACKQLLATPLSQKIIEKK